MRAVLNLDIVERQSTNRGRRSGNCHTSEGGCPIVNTKWFSLLCGEERSVQIDLGGDCEIGLAQIDDPVEVMRNTPRCRAKGRAQS